MAQSDSSLRTPLSRVRFLGSARLGTEETWRQKVTAVALIPLTVLFVWLVLWLLHLDYAAVRATLSHPLPALVTLAFALTGIVHMRIGMRSIIDDYAQGHAREWALIANTAFCGALALACAYAALRIGLA
jgi:succinate dehydrogenase / fumarate reductase membrane anchor subunit